MEHDHEAARGRVTGELVVRYGTVRKSGHPPGRSKILLKSWREYRIRRVCVRVEDRLHVLADCVQAATSVVASRRRYWCIRRCKQHLTVPNSWVYLPTLDNRKTYHSCNGVNVLGVELGIRHAPLHDQLAAMQVQATQMMFSAKKRGWRCVHDVRNGNKKRLPGLFSLTDLRRPRRVSWR